MQGSEAASKGDFLFSSDHLIEMATKLYRTTLSQTKQKLNIEISDEYVLPRVTVPFPSSLHCFHRALQSPPRVQPSLQVASVCLLFVLGGGWAVEVRVKCSPSCP